MIKLSKLQGGYACIPYRHDKESIEIKDIWVNSKHIDFIYFATATFPTGILSYFPSSANHYLIIKFNDYEKLILDSKNLSMDIPSFIFRITDELFERISEIERSFISIYYLEFDTTEDINDIADTVVKKDKVTRTGFAEMNLFCKELPKFTFPYAEQILVMEVAGDKSPQSICKYCEKTKRDICRKGVVMNNFASLSLLEKLK